MQWLWIGAWTYVIFVLQTCAAHELAIGKCAPHLLLAGLMLMAARVSGRQLWYLAALWGFLSDCLSDACLGADVIGFVLAALLVKWGDMRLGLNSPWQRGTLAAALVWCSVILSTKLRMPSDQSVSLWTLSIAALGTAVYTGALVGLASRAACLIGMQKRPGSQAATVVSNSWRMLTES
jgi:rod shape-determining protein MreD